MKNAAQVPATCTAQGPWTHATRMLPRIALELASRILPRHASGAAFHRRALGAAARGNLAAAERWFALAAERYRHDLAVEPLARMRVHQMMARARSAGGAHSEMMVEIVRLLNRLDRLESLEPPHELADARTVLAAWIEASGERARGPDSRPEAAARAA